MGITCRGYTGKMDYVGGGAERERRCRKGNESTEMETYTIQERRLKVGVDVKMEQEVGNEGWHTGKISNRMARTKRKGISKQIPLGDNG